MKKYFFLSVLFGAMFFCATPSSAAVDINLQSGSQEKPSAPLLLDRGDSETLLGPLRIIAGESGLEASGATTPQIVVANIIRYSLTFIGVIFVAMMLYAGFLWMTAQGNSDNIEKAQNILKNGAIGLGIVLASASIWVFVVESLYLATGGKNVEQAFSPE